MKPVKRKKKAGNTEANDRKLTAVHVVCDGKLGSLKRALEHLERQPRQHVDHLPLPSHLSLSSNLAPSLPSSPKRSELLRKVRDAVRERPKQPLRVPIKRLSSSPTSSPRPIQIRRAPFTPCSHARGPQEREPRVKVIRLARVRDRALAEVNGVGREGVEAEEGGGGEDGGGVEG